MRDRKTVITVLAALILVAGLALLPRGIAGISDSWTNGKPGTAAMESVELALGADKTDEPGYMMRKLALEQRMTTIPLKAEQAEMTEEQVLTAAMDGMTAYMEAGMFEWFEYSFCSAEAYLGLDPGDKSNNTIFWGVTFSTEKEPYHHLFVHIDYETYGSDQWNYYSPDDQRMMMEGFTASFFEALNLTRRNEYENLKAETVAEQPTTDEVTCVRYTFEDERYGTIYVEFTVYPFGFYVSFPRS